MAASSAKKENSKGVRGSPWKGAENSYLINEWMAVVPNNSPLSKKDGRAVKKKNLLLTSASTDGGWAESSTLSDSLNSSVVKGQDESAMAAGWEKSSTSPDSPKVVEETVL